MCRYHEYGTTVVDDQHVRITTVHSLFESHSNRLLHMHVDVIPNKCFEFQRRTLWYSIYVKILFKLSSLYFYISSINIGQLVERYSRPFAFLALLDCVSRANAVAWVSVIRRSSCCHPSVRKARFLRNMWINAKCCGKVAIHHIPR